MPNYRCGIDPVVLKIASLSVEVGLTSLRKIVDHLVLAIAVILGTALTAIVRGEAPCAGELTSPPTIQIAIASVIRPEIATSANAQQLAARLLMKRPTLRSVYLEASRSAAKQESLGILQDNILFVWTNATDNGLTLESNLVRAQHALIRDDALNAIEAANEHARCVQRYSRCASCQPIILTDFAPLVLRCSPDEIRAIARSRGNTHRSRIESLLDRYLRAESQYRDIQIDAEFPGETAWTKSKAGLDAGTVNHSSTVNAAFVAHYSRSRSDELQCNQHALALQLESACCVSLFMASDPGSTSAANLQR